MRSPAGSYSASAFGIIWDDSAGSLRRRRRRRDCGKRRGGNAIAGLRGCPSGWSFNSLGQGLFSLSLSLPGSLSAFANFDLAKFPLLSELSPELSTGSGTVIAHRLVN
ncbi:uncharacterized protein BO66DRAFT_59103 [Aspergillus aculeatinus CBS 121060]|uniref:Uncharacterized protein n=1 Tax=Aspergillus aculeatinus CBS 121060 TaxID=1448322 RepID=A0ACD1HCB9_9EURO|nr:hypothetical protein BO66DRAFT_59103 [Aspergillus aculeatinus CBS 121060]RAH71147.1 hypothetical protein BO66DRAFT_59103 [Aspergillus aculeatinus CBS 121060]